MSLYGGLLSNNAFNSCISASGGDEIGTFYSGSQVWRYHKFTTLGTGSFTIHSGSTDNARVFLVGGGGGGGRTINTNQPSGIEASDHAGGGGAGGVLLLEYSLNPRTYDLYVGDGGEYNENGEDTQMYPLYDTNDQIGEYFPTSSWLTAEGGGSGAYSTFFATSNPFYPGGISGRNGGSGGGGIYNTLIQQTDGSRVRKSFGNGDGRPGQGFSGGDGTPYGQEGECQFQIQATGGGGAGGEAETSNCIFASQYLGQAGEGINLNVDGTPQWYAAGGPGMQNGVWEPADNGNLTIGAGGYGSSDSSEPSPTNQESKGRQGIIVIMYPICEQELTDNCTQYSVTAGGEGGILEYVSCTTSSFNTDTLEPLTQGIICSYDTTADDGVGYPQTTGTVLLTETGSCESLIPLVTGSTCDTASGEISTQIYLTTLVVDAPPVGFPPPSTVTYPGYVTIAWEDYLGVTQQEQFGTGTYSICAIPGTIRSINYTVGSSWYTTATDIGCAYYCKVPSDITGSLIATGGDIENIVIDKAESTQTWYKIHTFNSDGVFSASSGSAIGSFDMLVVGGGGRGGSNLYAGGGGGGGVLYITSSDYLSSDGDINIYVGDGGNPTSTVGGFKNYQSSAGGSGGNGSDIILVSGNPGFQGASGGGGGAFVDNAGERIGGLGGGSNFLQGVGGDGWISNVPSDVFGGGGGGALQSGFDGNHPTRPGDGGDGKSVDIEFTSSYYGGGGAASSVSGLSIGGIGGGGNPTTAGEPNTGGGAGGGGFGELGGSGVVKIRYIYEDDVRNNVINSLPTVESLWSLIDIAYPLSYDGTGSTLYDVSPYFNNSGLLNHEAYEYNTAVLDSGSLILRSSSLDTDASWNISGSFYPEWIPQDFTLLVTWFGNNLEYNTSSSYFPIFSDNNSDWGIYGGDLTTWDNGIVINAGGQLIGVGEDTAGESGGGFIGWHISQVSYESSTNTIKYNCDNVSGSVIVSGSSLPTDFNPKWNDKLLSGKMGDNSALQVLAIYTSSLSLEQMRINHDSLDPRY